MQHRRISSVTLGPLEPPEKSGLSSLTKSRKHSRQIARHTLSLQKIILACFLLLCTIYVLAPVWHTSPRHTGLRGENVIREESYILSNIAITNDNKRPFASLGPYEKAVTASWEKAVSDLEDASRTLFENWFEDTSRKLFSLPVGIPGTGIDSTKEAKALQDYLDCTSSHGEWVYSPTGSHLNGSSHPVHKQSSILSSCDKAYYKHRPSHKTDTKTGWNVRPSLKWYWQPSATCEVLLEPIWMKTRHRVKPLVSSSRLCSYLRHKNILLVGDSPTHYLVHDLLLDWTSKRPLTCYGDLYCKEHAICADDIVSNDLFANQWQDDVRPYGRLQDPPPLSPLLSPSDSSAALTSNSTRTHGTVLRYRRADSMFFNSSPSHSRHQPAFIHPHTGVRDINMYAVADGRRSDVSILYKAPVPYLRPYKSGSALHKRLSKVASSIERPGDDLQNKMLKLIELSTLATLEIWLPEVLESLRAFKAPPTPTDSLIIYRGGWKMQDGCGDDGFTVDTDDFIVGDGPAPHRQQVDLGRIFKPSRDFENGDMHLNDIHTVYYNLQTVLQNHLIRTIVAPRLGMPFIDLETATGIWKSGFVGGAASTQRSNHTGVQLGRSHSSSKTSDCLRMCLPSPGLSLETLFLGSLLNIFEWSWGGKVRSQIWTGSSFVPARLRKHEIQKATGSSKPE